MLEVGAWRCEMGGGSWEPAGGTWEGWWVRFPSSEVKFDFLFFCCFLVSWLVFVLLCFASVFCSVLFFSFPSLFSSHASYLYILIF
jgi:hypothetical protein